MAEKNMNRRKYTETEMKDIQKSRYYREEMAPFLGKEITLDFPWYKFKLFTEDKNRACLRSGKIIKVGEELLTANTVPEIEHIWAAISKSVQIDPHFPIRVTGIPYEYAHKCGKTIVRNIGLNVRHVTQECFIVL